MRAGCQVTLQPVAGRQVCSEHCDAPVAEIVAEIAEVIAGTTEEWAFRLRHQRKSSSRYLAMSVIASVIALAAGENRGQRLKRDEALSSS